MLRTTLTAAWSRKRRLVGTALAIVLGVAFLTATLVLGDSARAGFRRAFSEANAGTDALVRGADPAHRRRADRRRRRSTRPSLDDRGRRRRRRRRRCPSLEGFAQVLDADGDPIGGDGPPTFAANWIDDPDLTGWDLRRTGARPLRARCPRPGDGRGGRASPSATPSTVLVPAPVERHRRRDRHLRRRGQHRRDDLRGLHHRGGPAGRCSARPNGSPA